MANHVLYEPKYVGYGIGLIAAIDDAMTMGVPLAVKRQEIKDYIQNHIRPAPRVEIIVLSDYSARQIGHIEEIKAILGDAKVMSVLMAAGADTVELVLTLPRWAAAKYTKGVVDEATWAKIERPKEILKR